MTSAAGRWPDGRAAFSRRRRKTFSTSMIASSTSAPMAIVSPPRVIVLIVIPMAFMVRSATMTETGSAAREMIVVRTFQRNRKRMTATRIAPSRRATVTFSTEVSMKSDWRKSCRSIVMPRGRERWMSSSCRSMAPVKASVLAPGCLVMPRTTAGRALAEPSPRLMPGPMTTRPSCAMRTGVPPREATTTWSMSSPEVIRPTPRMSDSCAPWM
jgi:hypothetical protein